MVVGGCQGASVVVGVVVVSVVVGGCQGARVVVDGSQGALVVLGD